ncbi:hypothetical protein GCM10023116_07620 [Kistimonas scapharcae]|uniref:Lipoprotein n=1 Tax=Kistimonas scapharcae TaxID=1036133 RepID=A0ABP8UX43_9GAMM
MKRLVPTLLAVLFLAGCAVNKPLPVEPVKLAGMEFYPVDKTLGYGLTCNSYSSRFDMNYMCLSGHNFFIQKMYDGSLLTSEKERSDLVQGNINDLNVSLSKKKNKPVIIKSDDPNVRIFKLSNPDRYIVM